MSSRGWIAELFGTFILCFAGCGAIVVDQQYGGALGHLGVCVVFGLAVMIVIYAFGDVSGAHINPAVTVAFWMARRFPGGRIFSYVGAQLLGAIVGVGMLRLLFPTSVDFGLTLPSGGWGQSLFLEVLLSFVLMLVILNVATGAKEKGITAGAAIGATVALAALVGGPVSGASMNPARSFGPAVVSGVLELQWIYLVGPLLGMALAVLACRALRRPGCCEEGEG